MRNVEQWMRTVDRRETLRVYTFTGNINTANQFLAPYYIIRNGILNVRLTLSGEPSEAMLKARADVRFGLVQQQHSFNNLEISLEKGDMLIVDARTDLLYGVICASVSYRDVMYGLGYVFKGVESRSSGKLLSTSIQAQFERRDMEERMYQDWWAAHGQEYTDGTYTLSIGEGAVYFSSIYPTDLPAIKKRSSFLKALEVDGVEDKVECKFDPERIGTLAADADSKAEDRDVAIYQAINKADEGGFFDAWNCFRAVQRRHGVTKEEFAAKVKFLEMGLWSRFKFWLARN
uniref:Uncharacterized protein n=1 Tax=Serratia phage Kevin TaxID=3161161 RepID=A0AAU8KZ70_9CAUD